MSAPNGRILDLDAEREAAAAEAAHAPFVFRLGGREFHMRHYTEVPAQDFQVALEAGDNNAMMDLLLDDPDAFWAIDPRPNVGEVMKIGDLYAKWSGLSSLGNSAASPRRVMTRT